MDVTAGCGKLRPLSADGDPSLRLKSGFAQDDTSNPNSGPANQHLQQAVIAYNPLEN
jgi:hypothetical protein